MPWKQEGSWQCFPTCNDVHKLCKPWWPTNCECGTGLQWTRQIAKCNRDESSANRKRNCNNLWAREQLSWITVTYCKCNCDASCKLAQKQVQCISQSRQSESNEARKKASKTNHKRLRWNQQSATRMRHWHPPLKKSKNATATGHASCMSNCDDSGQTRQQQPVKKNRLNKTWQSTICWPLLPVQDK